MKNVKRKFVCITVAAIAAAGATGCSSYQNAETYQQESSETATQESQQGTTEAAEQELQQDSTESETSAVEDKMDEEEPLKAAFEENPTYALGKKEGYEWHILHAGAQFIKY